MAFGTDAHIKIMMMMMKRRRIMKITIINNYIIQNGLTA
jgi:hypothetical protein